MITFTSFFSLSELDITAPSPSSNPPKGFPWHKWNDNNDDDDDIVSSLIKEVERINRGGPDVNDDPLTKHLFVYIIQDGQVYRPVGNYRNMKELFRRYLPFEEALVEAVNMASPSTSFSSPELSHLSSSRIHLQDMPIIVNMGDGDPCFTSFPVFSFFRTLKCNNSFPILTYDHWLKYRNIKNEDEIERQQKAWEKEYPFRKKIQKAIWRGTTTGVVRRDLFPNYNKVSEKSNWEYLPRAQLVQIGNSHPELIDAAFVDTSFIPGITNKLPQVSDEDNNEIRKRLKVVKRSISMEPFMKYRAIVDIDGNTWSSRFGMQLCFNSVTIKVEPVWVDYFHNQLVPWKHYIPVNANMSNLVDMVSYAMDDKNSEEIRTIIRNAQSWCRSHFTRKSMSNDLLWSLVSYQELLQSRNKNFVTKWKDVSSTLIRSNDNLQFQKVGKKDAGHWYPSLVSRLVALVLDFIIWLF